MFRVISECINITVFAALCVQFARGGDELTFHIGPGCLKSTGKLGTHRRFCKQTQQLTMLVRLVGLPYFHLGKSFLYTKAK